MPMDSASSQSGVAKRISELEMEVEQLKTNLKLKEEVIEKLQQQQEHISSISRILESQTQLINAIGTEHKQSIAAIHNTVDHLAPDLSEESRRLRQYELDEMSHHKDQVQITERNRRNQEKMYQQLIKAQQDSIISLQEDKKLLSERNQKLTAHAGRMQPINQNTWSATSYISYNPYPMPMIPVMGNLDAEMDRLTAEMRQREREELQAHAAQQFQSYQNESRDMDFVFQEDWDIQTQ